MNRILKDAFDNYVRQFDMSITQIRFKYHHSYEVEKLMKKLATMLNLKKEEIDLASVIGLLHDVGRFLQIKDYGECSDKKTGVDHAYLGVKYLFLENHIKDFYKITKNYDIIKDAIENHNKYKISVDLTEKNLLFSKMIRDIDKIDIYRVIAEEYHYIYNKDDISKEVLDEFDDEKCIESRYIKTKTDSIYSFIGFIYDINFKESFIILKETNYLNLLFDSIEVCDNSVVEFNNLRKVANDYIDEKIRTM